MPDSPGTFVILTPAFTARETETWLPAQERFILSINRQYPHLKVVILSFHFPVLPEPVYSWFGNEVITFSAGLKKNKLASLFRWRKVWKQLQQLRRSGPLIGILSFFCSECAFIGHHFAKRFSLSHHIWVLGQDARRNNKQVRRIRPLADELICISDFLQREFQKNHGIPPAHLIPIGIDTDLYTQEQHRRSIDLLGVGSLIPLKQYHLFIEVLAEIAKHFPGINARIYGAGPEEENIRQQITDYALQPNIQLLGVHNNQAVITAMQQVHILLHPSSYEGLGFVCLEALYAGAHVISFCKPFNTTIPHWHTVATKDEMIVTALSLLQNPDLDHSSVLPFEVNAIIRQMMSLYPCKE